MRPSLLLFASLLVACAAREAVAPPIERVSPHMPASPPAPRMPSVVPVSAPPPSMPEPPALAATEPFVELEVEGFEPAVVSMPLGAREPRPVLVATHGAGGRATTHCERWRAIVGDRGFVLCPRGRSMYPYLESRDEGRYYYPGHPTLGAEIAAAFAALERRFTPHVDPQSPIFAGYSQGASMGALVLPDHVVGFGRAVLVEGGVGEHQEWNVTVATRFREQGGERVLFVCGRLACYESAQTSAGYLRRGGLAVDVAYASGAGHTYAGAVGDLLRERFAWLVEGDARWR
ncbi:MAG: hypothetical protein R3B72_37635 [Polyangiaceae bacterium]